MARTIRNGSPRELTTIQRAERRARVARPAPRRLSTRAAVIAAEIADHDRDAVAAFFAGGAR